MVLFFAAALLFVVLGFAENGGWLIFAFGALGMGLYVQNHEKKKVEALAVAQGSAAEPSDGVGDPVGATARARDESRATDAAGASAAGAGSGSSRTYSPHLEGLIRYLWGTDQMPAPRRKAMAHAMNSDRARQLKGTSVGANLAVVRMPLGQIFVWDEYVAFLTESRLSSSELLPVAEALPAAIEMYRHSKRFGLMPAAKRAWSSMTTSEREALRKPLANPSSIILRTSEIRSVTRRSTIGMPWICLETDQGRFDFTMPSNLIPRMRYAKDMMVTVGVGQWEEPLFQMLAAMATRTASSQPSSDASAA